MKSAYKVEVVECKGIRIKGDDTSYKLAEVLEKRSNSCAKTGWKIHSIIPSLTSEGALLKFLVIYEKHVR